MMFTKKNTPPKLQRTLDGVRKEKDSLLTNPDGPPPSTTRVRGTARLFQRLLAVTTLFKSFFLPSLRGFAKQSSPKTWTAPKHHKGAGHSTSFSKTPRGYKKNESLPAYQSKTKKAFAFSFMGIAVLIVGVSTYFSEEIKGATYGWTQSSWSGGQTTNTATHTNNQENWTQYASKDSNLQADANGVTIAGTANTWVETSDSNFTTGTNTGVSVFGTGDSADIKLLKPFGATCSTKAECFDGGASGDNEGWCNNSICTNPWLTGSCAGIYVYYKDSSTGSQWKTTDTACDTPQCSQNGAQDGDNLVEDNNVDFSLYPARNLCKSIGGRLPTRTELQCIYNNRDANNYGKYGAFTSSRYWSSTEYSTTSAYNVYFGNGTTSYLNKTDSYYVRCVRGQ